MTRKIVVGTDGSPTATHAVRRAAELARAEGARLHIVTAYDPSMTTDQRRDQEAMPPALQWMASPGEAADRIAREAAAVAAAEGISTEIHSRAGNPGDVLVEVAAETGADLVVVGNRGMGGLTGFIRPSVPNRVSHRASCDVLIVNTTGAAA